MQENSEIFLSDLFDKNISDYIHPKFSLLKEIRETDASNIIVSIVKKVPGFESKLHDLEILCMVCNYIENMRIKGKTRSKRPDKLNILKTIYHNLYSIDPNGDDMKKILTAVDFLINHKKVKKISMLKKILITLKRSVKLM